MTAEHFDLVLADVKPARRVRLDLVQHVLAEYPAQAAVMATGMDDPALANRAIEIGAYGYMIKPFTTNQVLFGVKNAFPPQARDREQRPARDARADRARANGSPGALRSA